MMYPWSGILESVQSGKPLGKAAHIARAMEKDRMKPLWCGEVRNLVWVISDLQYDIDAPGEDMMSMVAAVGNGSVIKYSYVCASQVTCATFSAKLPQKVDVVAAAKDMAEEFEASINSAIARKLTRQEARAIIDAAFAGVPGSRRKKAHSGLDSMPYCRERHIFGTAWGASTAVAYAMDSGKQTQGSLKSSIFGESALAKLRSLGMERHF